MSRLRSCVVAMCIGAALGVVGVGMPLAHANSYVFRDGCFDPQYVCFVPYPGYGGVFSLEGIGDNNTDTAPWNDPNHPLPLLHIAMVQKGTLRLGFIICHVNDVHRCPVDQGPQPNDPNVSVYTGNHVNRENINLDPNAAITHIIQHTDPN